MEINQFSNILSDGFLAIVAFGLSTATSGAKGWKHFFFWMGVAAALGAVAHGFHFALSNEVKILSWNFLIISILAAELQAFEELGWQSVWLRAAVVLKAALFIGLCWYTGKFGVSVIDVAIGMLVIVTGTQITRYRKHPAASRWIIGGILFSAIPAVVQRQHLVIDPVWLDHNDLGHYLSALSLLMIYWGIKVMKRETHQT